MIARIFALTLASMAIAPAAAYSNGTEAGVVKQRTDDMKFMKGGMQSLQAAIAILYDPATIRETAGAMADKAANFPTLFPAGSTAESDALPAVWERWDDFSAAAMGFEARLRAVADAADDQGAAMAAFGQVGASCKTCHENFKKKGR